MVTNVLPAGMTFVSAVASQGTCVNASGTVTCNLGTLSVNGVASITLVATATTAGTKNVTAVVISNAQESNAADNSATATTKYSTTRSSATANAPENVDTDTENISETKVYSIRELPSPTDDDDDDDVDTTEESLSSSPTTTNIETKASFYSNNTTIDF